MQARKAAVDEVVGPGDVVAPVPESGQLRLGPGLLVQDGAVKTLKAGVLRQAKSGQLWLEGKQRRYIPEEGDVVVGYILDRHAENFVVDINGPFPALLPQLSFEGATKRNRPNLKTGDVVYARVEAASKDIEATLTCVDSTQRAGGLGHLKEGTVISVSTATARKLQSSPPAPVLEALGSSLEFEVATGVNGRVWVSAPSTQSLILVTAALKKSDVLNDAQVRVLVSALLSKSNSG